MVIISIFLGETNSGDVWCLWSSKNVNIVNATELYNYFNGVYKVAGQEELEIISHIHTKFIPTFRAISPEETLKTD